MCMFCSNAFRFSDPLACIAFPDGIPEDILTGEFDHAQEHDGDHGIRFKPVEPGDKDETAKSWNPRPIKR